MKKTRRSTDIVKAEKVAKDAVKKNKENERTRNMKAVSTLEDKMAIEDKENDAYVNHPPASLPKKVQRKLAPSQAEPSDKKKKGQFLIINDDSYSLNDTRCYDEEDQTARYSARL